VNGAHGLGFKSYYVVECTSPVSLGDQYISKGRASDSVCVSHVYLHCIPCSGFDKQEGTRNSNANTVLPAPQQGIDRLHDAGVSEAEIRALRRSFLHLHGSLLDTENIEEIRDREEQWMNSDSNQSSDFPANFYVSFVIGLVIGFICGLFSLIIIWENLTEKIIRIGS
jgi:hypothetical protein